MLYVLSFVACLASSPAQCRNVELLWSGTPLQCQLFGQRDMVAWQAEHPDYVLPRGWRCGPAEQPA